MILIITSQTKGLIGEMSDFHVVGMFKVAISGEIVNNLDFFVDDDWFDIVSSNWFIIWLHTVVIDHFGSVWAALSC